MVFIPLINLNASAGNGCLIPELGMTKDFIAFAKSWLTNITVTNPANLLVFTVVGDSMVGEINDGDMVVINKTMTELQNNGTYVVCIDNQLYVKVLQRIPGNKVQVISKNAKYAPSKFRVGQSDLRDILLNNKICCEICCIRNKELLITSHIKPWVKSNKFEKLDSENVLLLCSIHDALFDKGLISFSDDGSIIISTLLDSSDRVLLHLTGEEKILVDSKNKKEYLKFHRENILK